MEAGPVVNAGSQHYGANRSGLPGPTTLLVPGGNACTERMRTTLAWARTLALVAATASLALAGCTSSNAPGPGTMGGGSVTSSNAPGPGMMGGGSVTSSNAPGPGMMGGGSVYHYSKLTCTAPPDLPGRTVNVTLGDMGMTQMMGGTAPLGVHM